MAELECGHNQHVRHDLPWECSPWGVSPEGRNSRLGFRLNCIKCDRGEPSDLPGWQTWATEDREKDPYAQARNHPIE